MIAFDAVDEGRSDDGSLGDAISEDGIGITCQQVRSRSVQFACGAKFLGRIFNAAAWTLQLGISVCDPIVERYRGAVEYHLRLGKGPIRFIRNPFARSSAMEPDALY
ncbi:hypothetical protein T190_31205 [Sinorhizobium meliloti CCBAU 01290]|nr:hypothetical protein T190_31205 [Sinorhizobium meliloti CCBAU 01290]